MELVSQNKNATQRPIPLQLKDMPILYAWFGETVPQDYLISLSELDYPVLFLKNPKIQHKFSRKLMDIEKSDYYRLWHLYQHGGIYSDFDNTIDYQCLINLLEQYKNQDKLVFMTDNRHTREKTQQITTNLIYAPYPKMPILKKMLDYIDESKEKVWQFAGIKFVGQFEEPLEVNMSKCVYHTYDWSWFEASNEVLGANADPHPHYAKKLQKKSKIIQEKQRIESDLMEKTSELNLLQSELRRISNDNIELKNQILQVHDKIVAICPSASQILNKYEESLSSSTSLFFSSKSQESQGPENLDDKNQIKLCNRVNLLREQNNSLKHQNNVLQWEVYGGIFSIILILVLAGFFIRKRKSNEFNKVDLSEKPMLSYQ